MFRLLTGEEIPLEFHRARIVQMIHLVPLERRLAAIKAAGFNTFLLKSRDVFLDMLTDSGTNAMSDRQLAAMNIADDAYAGSESFYRFQGKIAEIFGKQFVLPVHQGRAAENIICRAFLKNGDVVPMNYHFTTTRAHIEANGGKIVELVADEAFQTESDCPFKGNFVIEKLVKAIENIGVAKIPFVRIEASTNLLGGQPFSLKNLRQVRSVVDHFGLFLILDASLLAENLFFIRSREPSCAQRSLPDLAKEVASLVDVLYFSARKLGCARGGAIATADREIFEKMKPLVPLYEGFLTYGGMSLREMEAVTVGLDEALDLTITGQMPACIEFMVGELKKRGIPVVAPPGALGCHIDAIKFLPHISQKIYPAGALAAALFLVSGIRGMERGTMSSTRGTDGSDLLSDMELVRLAMPRRVFTLSQIKFAIDRITWLYANRQLIGGLQFVEEPKVLRFFTGKLAPIGGWDAALAEAIRSSAIADTTMAEI
ncbi:MAG: tryptophanase [Puniceicoccales bacterium]|jgi:tryptophanase|nr:tryptophanase [Puniceicoccales bacterium]